MSFSPESRVFLQQLSENNERAWFEAHKADYERTLRQPALDFIEAMAGPLAGFAPNFRFFFRRMDGSLMRLHRDTRFSNDKSPYKTNLGIQFRHALGKDVHAPGFYVHLSPMECFLGVGCWSPEPEVLKRIRDAVADRPDRWFRASQDEAFRRRFELAGDSLSRPPRGYTADHPAIDDLKRKGFIAVSEITWEQAGAMEFVARVAEAFAASTPFMGFLCGSLGLSL